MGFIGHDQVTRADLSYPGTHGPGNEWFVSSVLGAASNSAKNWKHAEATVDAAIQLAAVGDTIWVAPDHAETLDAADELDIDVAGIQVVGVVRGRQMPTFNLTHVDAAILLAAANCTLRNVRITGGVDAIVASILASAADCAIIDCEFRDVTGEATDSILTTAAADRLLIDGYRHIGTGAPGADSTIALVGSTGTIIRNFQIYGNFAVGGIDFRTTASYSVNIHSGLIWTLNSADICIVDTVTGSTGSIGPDLRLILKDNAANITEAVTGASFHVFDPVYVCNLAGEKAMLTNITASVDEA